MRSRNTHISPHIVIDKYIRKHAKACGMTYTAVVEFMAREVLAPIYRGLDEYFEARDLIEKEERQNSRRK